MNEKKIKLLLVDDHIMIRLGLSSLLKTRPELEIAGDTGDGETALRLALRHRPDVIVMDLMMPEMDGIETTRRLLAEWPEAKVLILTTFGTSDGISQALDAGAKGAILKNADLTELAAAIQAVAAGEISISDEIRQILADDPPTPKLSARQQEILESITRGLLNPEIARQLGISIPMVREHTTALFQKLGAANRAEAVAIALRKQLVKM